MKRLSALLLAAAVLVAASPSQAQQSPSYPVGGFASQRAPGYLELCLNSAGQAVPVALCDQAANISKPNFAATPEHRAQVVTISPNSGSSNPYPSNATPLTGNSTGTTGAVVGTFAALQGKTNYICGFNVQAIGGTATVGPITVAGLVGSSQVYQTDVNSATVGKTVASASFSPCIPASAVNTAITITTTANGTATAVDVNSWGYRQ